MLLFTVYKQRPKFVSKDVNFRQVFEVFRLAHDSEEKFVM